MHGPAQSALCRDISWKTVPPAPNETETETAGKRWKAGCTGPNAPRRNAERHVLPFKTGCSASLNGMFRKLWQSRASLRTATFTQQSKSNRSQDTSRDTCKQLKVSRLHEMKRESRICLCHAGRMQMRDSHEPVCNDISASPNSGEPLAGG